MRLSPWMSPRVIASLLAASVLLVLAFGCGDDDDNHDQVAVDRSDGGQAGPWPGTCDPVSGGCPNTQQCTGACDLPGVMSKSFACAVPAANATATHGQPCGAGCAAGHDCFTVTDANGGVTSVCRKYCNTDRDCPGVTCLAEGLICTAGDPSPIGRLCALPQ